MTDELAAAIAIVEAVDIVGPEQQDLQRRILDFCARHDDALLRSCLTGHLTASALIVDTDREAVLLIHHVKLDRWLQPGGHVDGQGDLAEAALREAEEEVGIVGLELVRPAIDLDIHEIPERGDEPAHLHLDVRFLALAPPGSEPAINHESFEARWVGRDDPDGLIGEGELRRLVERGLDVALSARRRA